MCSMTDLLWNWFSFLFLFLPLPSFPPPPPPPPPPLLPLQHPQVFKSLCDLVTIRLPLSSSLSSTHFLSQCSSLQLAPEIQASGSHAHTIAQNYPSTCSQATLYLPSLQVQVLRCLTVSFQSLLSHPHWLVHHHAMEAFRVFAEVRLDGSGS